MAEENESTTQNENTNGVSDETQVVKNPDAVLKKNRELLAKLKEKADREKELADKLAQIEQEQLANAGKKDELIEQLKKSVREKEDKLKATVQTFALKSVNQQVLEAARAMGCEKPEVAMKLADLADVTVGDDFSVDADALKSALEKVKEEVPQLFKKNVAAPRDGSPANVGDAKKSPDKMSIAELQDLYKKITLTQ